VPPNLISIDTHLSTSKRTQACLLVVPRCNEYGSRISVLGEHRSAFLLKGPFQSVGFTLLTPVEGSLETDFRLYSSLSSYLIFQLYARGGDCQDDFLIKEPAQAGSIL